MTKDAPFSLREEHSTVVVGVRIPRADMERLDREAASRGTNRSAWVRQLLGCQPERRRTGRPPKTEQDKQR